MRQSKYITIITMACALFFASCSDEYMENMNTDPSKAATIDPNAQLTTAQLQTYGDLSMMEIYRNYHYAFTQQLMGCWNTTNYGGRHTLDNNEMSRIWTSFYTQSLKNIIDAQYRTAEDAEKVNINSVLRIYRVYLMSIITDTYGDAPFSEAGLGFLEGKFNPKYDKQEDIYNAFFLELEDAVNKIDPTKDKVTGDLIYAGDVTKWQQLANSLRLRFAMRISNVNPTKAQTEFENALAANGGVITDAFKISRCYYDGLMSATSPDNRVDITQEMIEKGIDFSPRDPGAYSWEPWPTGYDSDICAELAVNNPSVTATMAREVEPKLANNFLKSDNPGVVMTSAEVKFLMAEATVKKWNVGSALAEDLYKQGVRAAMDFLTDNYGCTATTDAEFDAFIQDKGAFGHTDNQKLEAINTQAWILHFTNPAECWANVRRSGYPKLKSPAEYGFGQYLTGGTEIPVRLCYPVLESSYNKKSYNEAIERMGGTDNWHSLLWWDTEN